MLHKSKNACFCIRTHAQNIAIMRLPRKTLDAKRFISIQIFHIFQVRLIKMLQIIPYWSHSEAERVSSSWEVVQKEPAR